jgi:hypothetical protein
MYNDGRYTERVESGELTMKIKRSNPCLDSKIQNWIEGTLSQEIRIYDSLDNLLVRAHRYIRPDGKLAASGLVDPKRIFDGGKWYALPTAE